ncbi:sigma 54-interacting transcriptional regulator [Halanaerobium praevalens]|uniref:HTH-type transcriptional regulatory protein TyrR n=1 Tax=Halanaerobium praevalens (strain ATCC 33744 / DSM 2228 / GSL) TaxID=572479 RepID=E3DP59_HALPG|nr:sigma 54-interacting transcriptional regulator [Halanaerobium praevalens]ADO77692.1 putative sigma54 specific transcriptional regulator [Halanaerobium praevalens DSM 2228]
MKVKQAMTKDPITLGQKTSIKKAAEIFYNNKIDGAPVISAAGEVIGIFTKSHIMKATIEGLKNTEKVSSIMTKDIITIRPQQKLEEVWQIPVGRLPVVNQKNKLIGILTRTDLLTNFFQKYKKVAEQYNTILNFTHNGIISVDLDAKVVSCNQAAEEMLGEKSEDIVGKKLKKVIPNNDIQKVLDSETKSLSQKVRYKDKTFLANRSPLYKEGELDGAISVFQDISELEEVSKELTYVKNLNKELDAIIESVSDGIYITDGNADTIRINSSYEKITGIKSEEVLGKNMEELVEKGVFSESVTFKVFEERAPVSVMHEIKTGQTVLSTGHPVFNEEGEIVRVVTTARDVKELNHVKEELNKAKKLSEKYYSELEKLRKQQAKMEDIVVKSGEMKNVMDLAIQMGRVDSTVLITGESGVGKEVVAKAIHQSSERTSGSLIKVNCGAIPDNLLEAELFGYAEGSFTGAKKGGKPGMFELADGGSLFLDEIAELPLNLQVKLLRVLQEEEIIRVGGTKPIKIDVRIIAATNRDLAKMLKEGEFREDLFYRLNVVPIEIPPLRERKEDISQLIFKFLDDFNKKYNKNKKIDLDTINFLESYDWPGNVRELKNLIERFVVISEKDIIDLNFLPKSLYNRRGNKNNYFTNELMPLKKAVSLVEKSMLEKAFKELKTTYQVAEVLDISQPTVVRKKKKYDIQVSDS